MTIEKYEFEWFDPRIECESLYKLKQFIEDKHYEGWEFMEIQKEGKLLFRKKIKGEVC